MCSLTVNLGDGSGHSAFIEQIADQGLAPLIAALRQPSPRPSPGLICSAQLTPVPVLFLIDRDGHIVRPVIPADGCGQPLSQVLDALKQVSWITG